MAEMVVSREPSRPIQPASGEGRKFSGSNAVAQKATAYHSNGNSKRFQKPGSRGCAKKFAATQATPKFLGPHLQLRARVPLLGRRRATCCSIARQRSSLGGFAAASRETAERASLTHPRKPRHHARHRFH